MNATRSSAGIAALATLLLFGACSSAPPVPRPPAVRVSLGPPIVTPTEARFVAKVVIENRTAAPLDITQVDYGAALNDASLFDRVFDELHPMGTSGVQTVTLPFAIPMSELVAEAEAVLAEEAARIAFHGTVVPVGWQPVSFAVERVVPLPSPPEIAFDGADGNPLEGAFTVYLQVRNTNRYPIACGNIATWLNLNGRKYDLVRSDHLGQLGAGESGRIALSMRQTRGKGISMIVNVVRNRSTEFTVGGAVTFTSPYATFHLPVEFGSNGLASPPAGR
ncbi:MAG: hypothetical protein KDE27_08395 [Planctomycetes bacterium]|nr:hypothetical protein [Planctomycetota bacterium]